MLLYLILYILKYYIYFIDIQLFYIFKYIRSLLLQLLPLTFEFLHLTIKDGKHNCIYTTFQIFCLTVPNFMA